MLIRSANPEGGGRLPLKGIRSAQRLTSQNEDLLMFLFVTFIVNPIHPNKFLSILTFLVDFSELVVLHPRLR